MSPTVVPFPLFLVYSCMSLDVASHTLAPGDTSPLPDLSLTRSFSTGSEWTLEPLLAYSLTAGQSESRLAPPLTAQCQGRKLSELL